MKKSLFAIFTICALFFLCSCGTPSAKTEATIDSPTKIESPTSSPVVNECSIKYNFKINPEFEISADDSLEIISVIALNEDAENVLSNVDVEGYNVTEAFSVLAEEARNQGYLSEEKGNTVNISILEKDDDALPTCHICNGCGTIKCAECNGTGILCDTCVLCGGNGYFHCEFCGDSDYLPCDSCDGSGYIPPENPGPECWSCHGNGICPDCNGRGRVIVTSEFGETVYVSEGVPETDSCIACKGSGVCGNCGGRPYSDNRGTPCFRCNNDGHGEKPGYMICRKHNRDFELGSECPDCHGMGYLRCGDVFNGYNWCPCCWGSGVEGTGDPNYEEWMAEHGY